MTARARCAVVVLLLCAPASLPGCSPAPEPNAEPRTLATIAEALDEAGAPDELLAHQHRLFEVLAEDRREELPRYLDLAFRFNDLARPSSATPSVGSRYLPEWRERPGLNYYQFLARDPAADAEWRGRTLEIVWSLPSAALVVAHRNETDPVFTEWRYRDGEWKAARMTINGEDEALQRARNSRQR